VTSLFRPVYKFILGKCFLLPYRLVNLDVTNSEIKDKKDAGRNYVVEEETVLFVSRILLQKVVYVQ